MLTVRSIHPRRCLGFFMNVSRRTDHTPYFSKRVQRRAIRSHLDRLKKTIENVDYKYQKNQNRELWEYCLSRTYPREMHWVTCVFVQLTRNPINYIDFSPRHLSSSVKSVNNWQDLSISKCSYVELQLPMVTAKIIKWNTLKMSTYMYHLLKYFITTSSCIRLQYIKVLLTLII